MLRWVLVLTVIFGGVQLDAHGEAFIQITSTANPALAAAAQIHVEVETGVVEGQPTLVEADDWPVGFIQAARGGGRRWLR